MDEVLSDLPSDLGSEVKRLSRASVLVVGDAMLDRYVYGEVNRISPEAPVPILTVTREVARSMHSSGASIIPRRECSWVWPRGAWHPPAWTFRMV